MARPPEKTEAPTTADLAAQIEVLRADVAALTGSLGDYAKARGNSAKGSARAALHDAQTAGKLQAERMRGEARDLQIQAEDFVGRKPVTSLGIAAILGFVFGMLSARR